MNSLPINKIFLAGFAFALTHWKKIIEISIIPLLISLPFLMVVPEVLNSIEQGVANENIVDIEWPENIRFYMVLFFYGYIVFSINMYRLVAIGEESVNSFMPIVNIYQIIKFAALVVLTGLLILILMSIGVLLFPGTAALSIEELFQFLQLISLVAWFLIIPITLSFVKIATHQPVKLNWNLSLSTRSSLFFLQIIFPMLIVLLFANLGHMIGLESILVWLVRIVFLYWTPITLALCYQLIQANNSAKNP